MSDNHEWISKSGRPWSLRVKSDLCAKCGTTPDAHPARPTPAEALDVERNGWWHPADCTNQHNEHGNCLGDDGMVVGWRDPVEYARLRSPESDEAR